MSTKSLTLRLTQETYREVEARKKGSITGYIVEAIREKLERDKQEELEKGFESLAGPRDKQTDLWLREQRKAMKNVDS